jgi:hypothetical protein
LIGGRDNGTPVRVTHGPEHDRSGARSIESRVKGREGSIDFTSVKVPMRRQRESDRQVGSRAFFGFVGGRDRIPKELDSGKHSLADHEACLDGQW